MSESQPMVSVITACYQHGRWLGDAVQSVLRQSYPRREIVIVNDGSTDSSADVAQRFVREQPGTVRYLETSRVGQAKARAAGARTAAGELWVLLDADDMLEPHMMERAVAALLRRPQAAAAVADVWMIAEDGRRILRLRQNRVPSWPAVAEGNAIGGLAGIMLRAEAVRRAGGLEGPPGAEDWDLWIRMARCGMEFVHVSGCLGRYRQAASSYSRKAFEMLRAKLDTLDRCRRRDERLDGVADVAPPIDDALHARLCNRAVFFALGVLAAAPPDSRDYGRILEHLRGAPFDAPTLAGDFRSGLWHAAVLGRSPHPVNLPPLLDALNVRLQAMSQAAALPPLTAALTKAAGELWLMRLKQHARTLYFNLLG